jgi:hypothetical protein
VACDSLVFDVLDFNIYAVANLAPITGTHSQIQMRGIELCMLCAWRRPQSPL